MKTCCCICSDQRVLAERILCEYSYPPGKRAKATETVLEQAEVLSEVRAVPAVCDNGGAS